MALVYPSTDVNRQSMYIYDIFMHICVISIIAIARQCRFREENAEAPPPIEFTAAS